MGSDKQKLDALYAEKERVENAISEETQKDVCLLCGGIGVLKDMQGGFHGCFGCTPYDDYGSLKRVRIADIEWAWNEGGVAQLVDNPVPVGGFGSPNLVRAWLKGNTEFLFLFDALEHANIRVLRRFMEAQKR